MGAVKGWLVVLCGFFILGSAFIMTAPLFDILFQIAKAFGLPEDKGIVATVKTALTVIPYFMGFSLILWGFIQATREEDDTRWFGGG